VANHATRGSLSRGSLTSVGWRSGVCGDEILTSRVDELGSSMGWDGVVQRHEYKGDRTRASGTSLPLPLSSAKVDSSLQAPAELFPVAMAKPPLQTATIILLVLLVAASCLHTVDAAALGKCVHTTTTCERRP
jgi:hypothetical protein